MGVRAKFWCTGIHHLHNGQSGDEAVSANITFAPVYDEANKNWSKWTPQGELKMLITNPAAIEFFKPGGRYYLDLTEAEDSV